MIRGRLMWVGISYILSSSLCFITFVSNADSNKLSFFLLFCFAMQITSTEKVCNMAKCFVTLNFIGSFSI